MFEYPKADLQSAKESITNVIVEKFTEDEKVFATPAVLAQFIKWPEDIELIADHFYAAQFSKLIPRLVDLHETLVKGNHDTQNALEVGSCDRYASYVKCDHGQKVIAYRNQNVSLVIVLTPAKCLDFSVESGSFPIFETHQLSVRQITQKRDGLDFFACDFNVNYDKVLGKYVKTAWGGYRDSEYFRYDDLRDRGFVITVKPYMTVKNGEVFYTAERTLTNSGISYILNELCSSTLKHH